MSEDFKRGLRAGIPIAVGYFSVSFAFGIFAVTEGLSVLQSVITSITNLTSAGQLAGVPIICAYGSVIELVLSQFIINLRYALMSISVTQKFDKSIRYFDRFWIGFIMTDEIFGVASSEKGVSRHFMSGLGILPIVGWTLGTLFGAVAGNILPAMVVSALGIAIYGMFIAIVVPPAKENKNTAMCVLFAIALSCCFAYIPFLSGVSSGFVIIICAVAASALFAVIAPVEKKEDA